jgi:NAD(P)H-dependent FMN reductase
MIVPEYNGSYPGILKYFIDHMKFPDSFESRPVCFVGLGGIFGGLRPVEHLQQVFGYRNSYIFPQRVFLINVHKIFVNNEITDPLVKDLVAQQTSTFVKFVGALKTSGLAATSKK